MVLKGRDLLKRAYAIGHSDGYMGRPKNPPYKRGALNDKYREGYFKGVEDKKKEGPILEKLKRIN